MGWLVFNRPPTLTKAGRANSSFFAGHPFAKSDYDASDDAQENQDDVYDDDDVGK